SKARTCPSRNDSSVRSSEKKAVCAPEYGNEATSAYTRPSRPASFGRSASRPSRAATPDRAGSQSAATGAPSTSQPLQVLLHEAHRPGVAVLVSQDLCHLRRLDVRPLLQQPSEHRLEWIEFRASGRSPVPRRPLAPRQPRDRPAAAVIAVGLLAAPS